MGSSLLIKLMNKLILPLRSYLGALIDPSAPLDLDLYIYQGVIYFTYFPPQGRSLALTFP